MIRFLACLLLALCACLLTANRAEAREWPLVRASLAPARFVNQVRVNRLEARAERGNRLAAARLDNTEQRMRARACN